MRTKLLITFMLFAGVTLFGQNILLNSEMDNGIDSWWTVFMDGATGQVVSDSSAMLSGRYSMRYDIENAGPNLWSTQLLQRFFTDSLANYRVSLLATSDLPNGAEVIVKVETPTPPYPKHWGENIIVTDTSYTFGPWEFTAPVFGELQFSIFMGGNEPCTIWFDAILLEYLDPAADVESAGQPVNFTLSQNYPNPFNPMTNINFTLAKTEQVRLTVYDLNGRLVSELYNGIAAEGMHSLTFDAADLPSGIYFYTLETAATRLTKHMTLVK